MPRPFPFDQDDQPSQPADLSAAIDHFSGDKELKEETDRLLAQGDEVLAADRQARGADAPRASRNIGRKALVGVAAAAAIAIPTSRDALVDTGKAIVGSNSVEETDQLSQLTNERSEVLRKAIASGEIRLPQQSDESPEDPYQQAHQLNEIVTAGEQMQQGQDVPAQQVVDQNRQ